MNCKFCNTALREGARFCQECGAPQFAPQSAPVITGNEWFAFVRNGNYTLKYKLSTDLRIICGKRDVAFLSHFSDEACNNHYYDLVRNENDNAPIVRFVRNDNDLSCVDPASGQKFFTRVRQSSTLGEIASGSKWQCGTLSLGQSGARSLAQWLPGGTLVASKYTILDNGRSVGEVKGSSASFSNSKTVTVLDPSRAWEILAVAIILSDDELG